VSPQVPPGLVVTGMGWWRPAAPGPDHGVREININAVLSYDGPYDSASGSPNSRGLPCRIERMSAAESATRQ